MGQGWLDKMMGKGQPVIDPDFEAAEKDAEERDRRIRALEVRVQILENRLGIKIGSTRTNS